MHLVTPGLELARSLVDIPVVSTLESTLLVSCTIGRSPGLLALDEMMAGVIEPLIDDYGFRERLAGVDTLHPHVSEFDLEAGFNGTGDVMERFRVNARRLIAKGADVLIPAEGVLNLLLVKDDRCRRRPLRLFGVVVAMARCLNLRKHRAKSSIRRVWRRQVDRGTHPGNDATCAARESSTPPKAHRRRRDRGRCRRHKAVALVRQADHLPDD
jgi:hypothetical protein